MLRVAPMGAAQTKYVGKVLVKQLWKHKQAKVEFMIPPAACGYLSLTRTHAILQRTSLMENNVSFSSPLTVDSLTAPPQVIPFTFTHI